MDFEQDAIQAAVLDGVDAILRRHPGSDPALLVGRATYNAPLDDALAEAGYVAGESGLGSLEAALVVMRVARAGATIPVSAHTLVAPLILGTGVERPVALLTSRDAAARFGAVARTALLMEPDGAHLLSVDPAACTRIDHAWAPAMAKVAVRSDERLGDSAGERLIAWWQIGIAAEVVGLLDGAMARTLEHLRAREQFGRPIGSFQAVQHRLAELAVQHEGARWLTCEAAWQGAPPLAAVTACTAALTVAEVAVRELHQVSGATGLTNEYGLHRFTFPLVALRAEAGGVGAQRRRLAARRWLQSSPAALTGSARNAR